MDKEYTKEQKSKMIYILFDFIVSILLLFSFKIYRYCPIVSISLITLVPFCFLVYQIQLTINKEKWQSNTIIFHSLFSVVFLIGVVISFKYFEALLSYFILFMILVYGVYVFTRKLSNNRPTDTFVGLKSKYNVITLGEFEDIFDRKK